MKRFIETLWAVALGLIMFVIAIMTLLFLWKAIGASSPIVRELEAGKCFASFAVGATAFLMSRAHLWE